MSSNEHEHLNDMSDLRYLVIDEADRMLKQGNFPQLEKIFRKVKEGEDEAEESDDEDDDSDDGDGGSDDGDDVESDNEDVKSDNAGSEEEDGSGAEDDDEMTEKEIRDFLGFTPENSVKMLTNEILRRNEKIRSTTSSSDLRRKSESDPIKAATNASGGAKQQRQRQWQRQTFVYSATLTLHKATDKKRKKKSKASTTRKDDSTSAQQEEMDADLQTILERAGATGKTKTVDLTSSKQDEPSTSPKGNASTAADEVVVKLPQGLTLYQAKCTQHHKDSYCYAYLATTKEGQAGPAIVFCNSILGAKRVSSTLQVLGLKTKILHAELSQVSSRSRGAGEREGGRKRKRNRGGMKFWRL